MKTSYLRYAIQRCCCCIKKLNCYIIKCEIRNYGSLIIQQNEASCSGFPAQEAFFVLTSRNRTAGSRHLSRTLTSASPLRRWMFPTHFNSMEFCRRTRKRSFTPSTGPEVSHTTKTHMNAGFPVFMRVSTLVRGRGFEPPRINHTHLKRARLPVPPPSHMKF